MINIIGTMQEDFENIRKIDMIYQYSIYKESTTNDGNVCFPEDYQGYLEWEKHKHIQEICNTLLDI